MKLLKSLLAGVMAMALTAGTAFAGSASTPMTISGLVVGTCSISTTNLDIGSKTADELNALVVSHNLTINCSDGAAYTVFPDNPATPWTLNGGTAKNIAGGAGAVWMMAFRADGSTSLTPTSGWNRTGTGADETVTMVLKFARQGLYFGALSATIQPTVQWN